MMDYEALRSHVGAIRVSEIPEIDNKYLIGVVYHTTDRIEEIHDDADVIWVRTHGKITVEKLKATYLKQSLPNGCSMPSAIDLIIEDQVLKDDVIVSALDWYKDKLVILRASRSPLATLINRQLTSPKSSAEQIVNPFASGHKSPSRTEPVPTTKPIQTVKAKFATRSISETSNAISLPDFAVVPSIDTIFQDVTLPSPLRPSPSTSHGLSDASPSTDHGLPDALPVQLPFTVDGQAEGESHMQAVLPRAQSELNLPNAKQAPKLNANEVLGVPRSLTMPLLHSTETKQEPSFDEAIMNNGNDAAVDALDVVSSVDDKSIDVDETPHEAIESPRSPSPEIQAREFFTAVESEMEQEREEEYAQFDGAYMRDLYNITDVKHFEAIVRKGLKNISILEAVLQSEADDRDVAAWLTQAKSLKEQARRKRTIVGIVGNTGAGKSSVINALLGEEHLVPTNCMRACTAVVTELAWNEFNEPHRRYRAEIEFINEAEWKKELEVLFAEMLDADGVVSRDTTNAESEAGIAYAKVKAVYPSMTKEDLARTTMARLLRKPFIKAHLGRTKGVVSEYADKFYRSLSQYVDTKEKDNEGITKENGRRKPEWWPLIKCVRIYLKAEALSTGAVLVDLPGVQDSNAARAAVADGYMKQCSGLWIVAPITRAVNDKAAKKLLGDQFKRQMKFDGMFSNVTFICSKTDDISVTEAVRSLGLESEISEIKNQVEALNAAAKSAAAEFKEVDEKMHECSAIFLDADADQETWSDLKKSHAKGRRVWPPRPKSAKKRKRAQRKPETPKKTKKRANTVDEDFDDFFVDDDDVFDIFTEAEDEDDEVKITQPLTKEDIEDKLEELKRVMHNSREEGTNFKARKRQLKEEMQNMRDSKYRLDDKQKAICIAARNEWSRSRIQDDYAMGIKELDQECAEEDDEDNFDPNANIRDYEQVARSLPVFCVSSRAYQTMSGRFLKDGKTRGFEDLGQTELPQLKEHCMKMTETNRIASSKMFLENLTKMLLSMSLWSSNDGSSVKLTDEEQESERCILNRRLEDLETALDKAIDVSLQAVRATQADHVQKLWNVAISAAEAAAIPTAARWGAPKDEGGLHWSTYKAIMRRDGGPYTNPRGSHDLNKQLSDAFERYIVSGWERCFQRNMPVVLKTFGKSMGATLEKFHEKVSDRARTRGVGIAGIGVMAQKLVMWSQGFDHLAKSLNTHISEKQKEANREICPVIADAMLPAYRHCANESGGGSFKRMKEHMQEHVESKVSKMFKACANILDKHLQNMRSSLRLEMENSKDELFREIRRDYMNVIAGVQLSNEQMTRAQRQMRTDVYKKVLEANAAFIELVKHSHNELDEGEEASEDRGHGTVQVEAQDEQDADELANETWFDEPEIDDADEDVEMTEAVSFAAVGASGALGPSNEPAAKTEAGLIALGGSGAGSVAGEDKMDKSED